MARKVAAALACGVLVLAAGCGEDEGVGEGATATIYAGVAYCHLASRALENEGGRVGSLRVQIHCLPSTEKAGVYDLAQIGANARRATEDSTTVAYIGEPEPHATRFSETILEEAGIAQLSDMNGSQAMHKILDAIRQADTSSDSLRESVRDELQ
ncbi:MAG TPA: hypothetical protein VIE64_08475 [Solirubrobacterales bacterium]